MLGASKLNFKKLKCSRVFEIFEEISRIPHGSKNCKQLSDYCVDFAKNIGLKFYQDDAFNVVIYKDGTFGLENSEPVILQGHIDMVCQKTNDSDFDFINDSLKLKIDGDFLTAENTTLGADNGIAVAMVLAILEDNSLKHPPIEAVFTTDEEIGMIGAGMLDMLVLKSKRMVNIDAEEDDTVIVSCAGGCDFIIDIPIIRVPKTCKLVSVEFKGLLGGHSGVEINSGRENANKLCGGLLSYLNDKVDFDIVSINGGDKGNAITNYCCVELCSENTSKLCDLIFKYGNDVKSAIASREKDFKLDVKVDSDFKECSVFTEQLKESIVYILSNIPNGVVKMSNEIENLVETSLNLGIVKTNDTSVYLLTSLRSNKENELYLLQDDLKAFFKNLNCNLSVLGFYPPWEFKNNSELQSKYSKSYQDSVGRKPNINAIHAGLECAVFASKINDIDCIAIGPNIYDVHTVNEKLSISSTVQIFELLINLLANL